MLRQISDVNARHEPASGPAPGRQRALQDLACCVRIPEMTDSVAEIQARAIEPHAKPVSLARLDRLLRAAFGAREAAAHALIERREAERIGEIKRTAQRSREGKGVA